MNRYGIVGLPNVGKSTLFNALTHSSVPAEKYPFSTKDHHVGVVEVPDPRLGRLSELIEAIEVKPTAIEFVDIAGLVKGAHKGEGLGNRFLSYILEVDCIIEVVRLFGDETVAHIDTRLDPASDIDAVNLELILKDLETLSKRKDKLTQMLRTSKEKKYREEMELLEKLKGCLDGGGLASSLEFGLHEMEYLRELSLLTTKPFLYVVNLDEDGLGQGGNEILKQVEACARRDKARALSLSVKIEDELSRLPDEEAEEFRQGMDLGRNGLKELIAESYLLLNLITFFTVERRKLSAWTLKDGTTVQKAAGRIHTDMERGFISAEVIHLHQLEETGSVGAAHKIGLVRQEGKDYVVQDGDVITFRFNV